MRHEHLVVTVEAGIKGQIEDDLDGGETVEAWIADAIEAKLADEPAETEKIRIAEEDATEAGRGGRTASDEFVLGDDGTRAKTGGDGTGRGNDGSAGDGRANDGSADDGPADDGTEKDDDGSADDYDEGFEYVDDCGI